MRKQRKADPKFFPFAPGIPWRLEWRGGVKPEMDMELWKEKCSEREFVVFCFGGPMEVVFALSAAKMINLTFPDKTIYFKGLERYYDIVSYFGNVELVDINFKERDVKKYTTPLFFDEKEHVFVNMLKGYIREQHWTGRDSIKSRRLICHQAFRNSLAKWSRDYVLSPLFSVGLDSWCRINKFDPRQKFALIIPDNDTEFHDPVLNWTDSNIKEFIAMMKGAGIETIVYGRERLSTNGIFIRDNRTLLLDLIRKADFLLSNSFDWQVIGLLQNENVAIATKKLKKQWDILKNADFLLANNYILSDDHWVSPMDAFLVFKEQ